MRPAQMISATLSHAGRSSTSKPISCWPGDSWKRTSTMPAGTHPSGEIARGLAAPPGVERVRRGKPQAELQEPFDTGSRPEQRRVEKDRGALRGPQPDCPWRSAPRRHQPPHRDRGFPPDPVVAGAGLSGCGRSGRSAGTSRVEGLRARHSIVVLPCFIAVVSDEAVQAEFLGAGRRKPMASQFHSVLSSMIYRVVHEFLYAASLPHQSKVRVGAQSARVGADKVTQRLSCLPVLSLVCDDASRSEARIKRTPAIRISRGC